MYIRASLLPTDSTVVDSDALSHNTKKNAVTLAKTTRLS